MEYRAQHVQFVSGWSGTSLLELSVLLSLQHVLTAVCIGVCSRLAQSGTPHPSTLKSRVLVEFCVLVVPGIACCTCLARFNHVILLCAAALWLVQAALVARGGAVARHATCHHTSTCFLTMTRGSLHLHTAVCILAVDFSVFPRRLAKAETYGCGLMDLAVGFYVICHGVTARLTARAHVHRALGLAALAATRALLVKVANYHEHVSEYGLHWNFFATLSSLHLLVAGGCKIAMVMTRGSAAVSGGLAKPAVVAVALALIQQWLLSVIGAERWVISADGVDRGSMTVVQANREAFASITGYLALFVVGVTLRRAMRLDVRRAQSDVRRDQSDVRREQSDVRREQSDVRRAQSDVRREQSDGRGEYNTTFLLHRAALLACLAVTAVSVVHVSHISVSRRLANTGYLLVTSACAMWTMAGFIVVQLWQQHVLTAGCTTPPRAQPPTSTDSDDVVQTVTPVTLQLANQHGLLLFCAANVATGVVNMSLPTIHMSTASSMCVLLTYTAGLLLLLLVAERIRPKYSPRRC